MRLSNSTISIDIPDADWQAALEAAGRRRGKDEPDARTAARGQILGRAMAYLRRRHEAARAAGQDGSPPEPDHVAALARLMMHYDAYGHDAQAEERMRLGMSVPQGVRPAPGGPAREYEATAAHRIVASRGSALAARRRDARLPPGWVITVLGHLSEGYTSRDTHVSGEAW
jgi:hypothetical protein